MILGALAVFAAACAEQPDTTSDPAASDRASAVAASPRFPPAPDPSTLPPVAGDYVQVNNLPAIELPGMEELLRDVFSRTHSFAADGSTTVVVDKTGEVHARGHWRLDGRSFELTEGSQIILRGHYYGDEIRVTPGALDDTEAALIVLRRK